MIRIAILTASHLCHNPRVLKEASTLTEAGYAVEVLGAWPDPILRRRDEQLLSQHRFAFTPVVDYAPPGFMRLRRRVFTKLGRVVSRLGCYQNPWQLGSTVSALRGSALASSADLHVAHSEAGMFVARELLRSGRRVGVDMEDWFSEDLLPETRKRRPVRLLRELEQELLRHGAHSSCPSKAMSDALSAEFGCVPPTVVYNAFPWSDRDGIDGMLKDRRDRAIPSIHWYSQTLGEGRGLEDLATALPYVTHEAQIHLRGHPASGFESWLSNRLSGSWRERVHIHGLVPNDELLSRIAEHDIGFAGEMKYSRSRDLTVTNKILQYWLAGLPVVASDTSGQQEIARQAPGAVFIYRSGDAAALADRLNALLASQEMVRAAKAAALDAAERTFCWERQEGRLLEAVARAVAAPAVGAKAR
jgi:glycosyltransferase involved in cell wall biosynthesis